MLSSGAFPFQGSSVSCRAMSKGEGCPSPFSSNPAFQKPIQNPYGHQKNPYIRANQSTARNANQITEPLENTGVTAVSSPQTTTAQNTPKGTRNDEVAGSIPASSSRRILRNHAVSEDSLFYHCFEPYAKRTYALKISNILPQRKGRGFAPGLLLLFPIPCRFQSLPENIPCPLDAFLIGMGVHSQDRGLVCMAQLLTH